MRTFVVFLLTLLCAAAQALASAKTYICYLDGVRVEYDATARKGYLEAPLPADMVAGSLRVRPVGDCAISRVEIAPARPDAKAQREVSALTERRELLRDRLRALETREEIFKASAKSQSGRAVRKTKNNPEPLANIRRGTEFALSQLETVYTARRRTERELADLESRLAALRREKGVDGSVARVWLSRRDGRVRLVYLLSGRGWSPVYDFRLDGGGIVETRMRASLPPLEGDAAVFVTPGRLADEAGPGAAHLPVNRRTGVAGEYRFPVEGEDYSRGEPPSLSFSFRNRSATDLPAGEASCYWKGEFLGAVPFAGVARDGTVSLKTRR